METGIIYERYTKDGRRYQIAKKSDGAVFGRSVRYTSGGTMVPGTWNQLYTMPDLSVFTVTDKTAKRFPKTLNLL